MTTEPISSLSGKALEYLINQPQCQSPTCETMHSAKDLDEAATIAARPGFEAKKITYGWKSFGPHLKTVARAVAALALSLFAGFAGTLFHFALSLKEVASLGYTVIKNGTNDAETLAAKAKLTNRVFVFVQDAAAFLGAPLVALHFAYDAKTTTEYFLDPEKLQSFRWIQHMRNEYGIVPASADALPKVSEELLNTKPLLAAIQELKNVTYNNGQRLLQGFPRPPAPGAEQTYKDLNETLDSLDALNKRLMEAGNLDENTEAGMLRTITDKAGVTAAKDPAWKQPLLDFARMEDTITGTYAEIFKKLLEALKVTTDNSEDVDGKPGKIIKQEKELRAAIERIRTLLNSHEAMKDALTKVADEEVSYKTLGIYAAGGLLYTPWLV